MRRKGKNEKEHAESELQAFARAMMSSWPEEMTFLLTAIVLGTVSVDRTMRLPCVKSTAAVRV